MEAQINSQSVFFSLMPVRHEACQNTLIDLLQSSPTPRDEHFLVRKQSVFSLACFLQARPMVMNPRWKLSHSLLIQVHRNELKFAKRDNSLMPSAPNFFSHSKPPAKSLPKFSSTCVGVQLSLQKSSSKA